MDDGKGEQRIGWGGGLKTKTGTVDGVPAPNFLVSNEEEDLLLMFLVGESFYIRSKIDKGYASHTHCADVNSPSFPSVTGIIFTDYF